MCVHFEADIQKIIREQAEAKATNDRYARITENWNKRPRSLCGRPMNFDPYGDALKYFRKEGLLGSLTPQSSNMVSIGKNACRDPNYLSREHWEGVMMEETGNRDGERDVLKALCYCGTRTTLACARGLSGSDGG